ncbi:4Fe-4S binding protein [Desulfitobacterium chlororespirans]|uniref:Ferredoxin-type protein NapH n=1 Tax=Desulfitobacterium chlororespirans DSM 11544 TaxID=1121395 RepID=A0A1M7SZ39_9FIRM|nr:4Fe-4S binding protein [Desulfitobacterium chlororespirans]SHN63763.1 ferredoxin-type protein NapH [Desulfitobacterium chlororespirans DSM 11544]
MEGNRTRTLRMTTMAVVVLLIVIGGVWGAGTGTLSSFGVKSISAICPLGFLETTLASRTFMPHLFISFLVIAGITVLLGKVFCGWICPVPLVRYGLTNRAKESQEAETDNDRESSAPAIFKKKETADGFCTQAGLALDQNSVTGLSVLGASLASSAVFGFPVFCLICPIGLIFATLFALMRLFQFNEPTFDLLIFPIVIIVELVFLKKWCSKWCPVGALLGIFSRFNRRLIPTVDSSLCLEETNQVHCHQCQSVCSFNLDPKQLPGTSDISECTKCKECADRCPVQAITFPWKKSVGRIGQINSYKNDKEDIEHGKNQ